MMVRAHATETVMFNERKAAQAAAWFLQRQGKAMSHLKLIKLLYLADRAALAEYGFSITGDRLVSMPHGPVLSKTLDLINGYEQRVEDGWEAWISDRENHTVALRERGALGTNLDELSAAEMDVLNRVWQQFGHMDQWALRDYTHDPKNCPEWQDPQGSAMPITFQRLFEALGRSTHDAKLLAERIEEQDRIDKLFASI